MLDLAIQHRLPVLTSIRLGPSLGALMSYGSDYFALARQSAVYIDKILKGEKPAICRSPFPPSLFRSLTSKPPRRWVSTFHR
jgi:ABC-type uncharacterized transport system substrate-binding protein